MKKKIIFIYFVSFLFSAQGFAENNSSINEKNINHKEKIIFRSIRTKDFDKIINLRRKRNQQWGQYLKDQRPKALKLKVASKEQKKKIRNVINFIVKELDQAKTVNDWINKSPSRLKLFRRKYFSNLGLEKIPEMTFDENQIFIFDQGKQKAPSIFKAYVTDKGVEFFYNRKNVTVRKGENLETWYKRMHSSSQSSLLDFIFPKAYANTSADWADALASSQMAFDDQQWLNYDFSQEYGIDGARLLAQARDMQDYNNLQCVGTEARYETRLGGLSFNVRAMSSQYADSPGNQLLFNTQSLSPFSVVHNLQGNTGIPRLYSNNQTNGSASLENFLPELSGVLNGTPMQTQFPESDNFNSFNSDTYSDSLASNAMAYQACVTMSNNGVEACSDQQQAGAYLDCVSENVIGGKLPGGMRFMGTFPWSMSRTSALSLKAELAGIVNYGQINIPRGTVYPSYGATNGWNVQVIQWNANHPGNGRANLITRMATGLRGDEMEAAFQLCLNSINDGITRTNECTQYIQTLPQEERASAERAISGLEVSVQNQYGALRERNSQWISDLQSRVTEAGVGRSANDSCGQRFNGPEQQALINHLAELERVGFQNRNLGIDMDRAIAIGDLGRACCTNNRCRMFINGTLPQEEESRIRGVAH